MVSTHSLQSDLSETLAIPHLAGPLSLRLPPEIAALREAALDFHQRIGTTMPPIPELILSDAAAWAAHTEDEDWLVWRARWCAARLRAMPVELAPGERIVGRPRFRDPAEAEQPALAAARQSLAAVPPFPGGDAGHFHPDYDKLFRLGIRGLLDEIATRKRAVADWPADRVEVPDGGSATGSGRGAAGALAFYDACRIALEGMSAYIDRVGDACAAMAEQKRADRSHWLELAAICRRVATEPPRTFHEAIELLFLTLVALWQGEGHGLTSPGRLDRTLRPFYEADLAAGGASLPRPPSS